MRRLAGKEETEGGKPHPKCLEVLANTLTDPSAFSLLEMAAGKHGLALHPLLMLPFLQVCPAGAWVSLWVFSPATLPGPRGTSCLQLLRSSTAVGLGLPCS